MSVVIETNLGSLPVELLLEQAPKTCYNFLKLAKSRYYEYCLFHRIERDFIAQTGDPTGSGKGGESIWSVLGKGGRFFGDELADTGNGSHVGHKRKGTLAMANNGRNKNASQFYFTLADGQDYLDERYSVFGLVDEGALGVLDAINEVICDEKGNPLQRVWIKAIQVLEDPFPDPEGLIIPEIVEPSEVFKLFEGVDAADLVLRESQIPAEELEAKRKQEDAKAQALTLEMIGDLPSAEVKPPENVLFVCKLNPMTESEDLKTIFSRFGPIRSCQIIRDKETGNSLGYAFVEFEERESCEEAYLKMDNVLIDDRRIHVDFSQSVSKLHGMWERQRRQQSGAKYEMVFDQREIERRERHDHRDRSSGRHDRERRDDRDRRGERRDDRGRHERDYRDRRDRRDSRERSTRDRHDSIDRSTRDRRDSRDRHDHHRR